MKHPFILVEGLNFKNFESFITSSFLISSAVNKIIGGLILDLLKIKRSLIGLN
jgi:hypothetical protein